MHEVLAPLLFVMHNDQHSLLRARELASVRYCSSPVASVHLVNKFVSYQKCIFSLSDRAVEILDPASLEEDT